jgi:hypothetical protein
MPGMDGVTLARTLRELGSSAADRSPRWCLCQYRATQYATPQALEATDYRNQKPGAAGRAYPTGANGRCNSVGGWWSMHKLLQKQATTPFKSGLGPID